MTPSALLNVIKNQLYLGQEWIQGDPLYTVPFRIQSSRESSRSIKMQLTRLRSMS
ncbi:MAG: hypothetical protein ACFB16_01620 [Phormidesmis sp.]